MDYEKLGLKCGIEIHQQISGQKLFCKCPAEIREDNPHSLTTRKLRAVAGEAGDIDIAARQEMAKGKRFVYEGYLDSTCLVELDETPPKLLNEEALNTALQAALLLNAVPVDEVHVMRKTIVDGSNTAGFQRTCLVARNGTLESGGKKIGIDTICLEEDSARIIKKEKDFDVYRLDRLGIPLIEIATSSDIKTPDQCRETAEKLGMILRSTGKVKRGIGTIRQDVNVSIKEGARVEIKGAQELRLLPRLVEYEILRQMNLLEIKNELNKRKVKNISGKIVDITKTLKNSGSGIIRDSVKAGNIVLGLKLEGLKGLVGKEIQPKRRLGTEFADLARITSGIAGIIHSDELPGYGVTDIDVGILSKELGCKGDDAFVLITADAESANRALSAIAVRAEQAIKGVPKEVRKANEDGTTSFLRPMPGAARMYPETDIPTIRISREMIGGIKIPELIEDKQRKYEALGLSRDLAELLVKSGKAGLFDSFSAKFKKLKPAYIAELVLTAKKSVKSEYGADIEPTDEDFEILFRALNNEQIAKERVLEIFSEKKPLREIIAKYSLISDTELKEEIKKLITEHKDLPLNALVGKAMETLRGKASGKKIVEMLRKVAG